MKQLEARIVHNEHLFMLHSFSVCDCAAQTLQTWCERTATGSDALHEGEGKESRNQLLRKQKWCSSLDLFILCQQQEKRLKIQELNQNMFPYDRAKHAGINTVNNAVCGLQSNGAVWLASTEMQRNVDSEIIRVCLHVGAKSSQTKRQNWNVFIENVLCMKDQHKNWIIHYSDHVSSVCMCLYLIFMHSLYIIMALFYP